MVGKRLSRSFFRSRSRNLPIGLCLVRTRALARWALRVAQLGVRSGSTGEDCVSPSRQLALQTGTPEAYAQASATACSLRQGMPPP